MSRHGTDLSAPYGGPGWSPRSEDLRQERGVVWGWFGLAREWDSLRAVLLHTPSDELAAVDDPAAAQMLDRPDSVLAGEQHSRLCEVYEGAGVMVHQVEPVRPTPNLVFVADLLFMTPQGAILARPASTVRAGEEAEVQAALARLRVPVLGSVHGDGVFEGADALWLDRETVLLATGLRTDSEGGRQVGRLLAGLGVTVIRVGLRPGTMHLMGVVRLLDRDLAVVRKALVPDRVLRILRDRGVRVLEAEDEQELRIGQALNVVPLAPRRVVMPAGQSTTRRLLETAGVDVVEVDISELAKAAGGIACMTGVLHRGEDEAGQTRQNDE